MDYAGGVYTYGDITVEYNGTVWIAIHPYGISSLDVTDPNACPYGSYTMGWAWEETPEPSTEVTLGPCVGCPSSSSSSASSGSSAPGSSGSNTGSGGSGGSGSGGSGGSGSGGSEGCPPQPSDTTISVGGGSGVEPGTTESFTIRTVGITPAPPWDADDYARCWEPVGTLQTGAWADNSGTIGGAAVAAYDHQEFLDTGGQTGTTTEMPCTVTLDGTELVLNYSVTNAADPAPPLPPWYTNPSSITGSVKVTWVAR